MLNPIIRAELQRLAEEGSTPEIQTFAGLILRMEENFDNHVDEFDNHTHDADGNVYRRT